VGATEPEQPGQEVPASVDTSERISKLMDQVADRVLVSHRSSSTDPEVRIKLRQTVLQGTEITIHHEQGDLVVSLSVGSRELGEQLLANTGTLQSGLMDRLHEPVRVEVAVRPESGRNDGAENEGGQSDGRSRNRRDPREELQELDE